MKVKPTQISLFDFYESLAQPPEDEEVVAVKNETGLQGTDLPKAVENTEDPVVPVDEIVVDIELPVIEEKTVQDEIIDFSVAVITPVKQKAVKQKSTRGRKSIQEMTDSVHLVDVPEDEILFQKSYYSIGKVAAMFGVNQSLIRLWENEFDVLKPKKNSKGDRLFRPEDVKNIQLIHHLMREKKYTMEGAKTYFRNNKKADSQFAMIESLKKIKDFLLELKANL
jgi:DNA-binding transcriptional MerR regulator